MTNNQIVFTVLCFLAALSLVMMAPAFAQSQGSQCARHDQVVAAITGEKYNETRRAMATTTVATGTNLVEVFASKAGTWTVIVSTPTGLSCIVASGESWEELPPEIEGKNS